MSDLRTSIQSALQDFAASPLRGASLDLLRILGYQSDKTIHSENSSPQAFLELIETNNPESGFNAKKALIAEWKSADLLFQLTDDELSGERSLFEDAEVKPALLKSYLFFAIELTGGNYARGKLTTIARQINRAFPMPVMLLIKHGDASGEPVLSIAVINRRRNERDTHKDVLGKVTIIRDISLATAHRGHLDILDSIAFENLKHPQKLPIHDFDTLHAAWEEIFNVELLNKRFYKELANWYFWALSQVEFPADLEPDDEKRRATGLIRLLTRLIFCWFLKEKGLVPETLFHQTDLDGILADFDPEAEDSSSFYHAILQNLFFATLNQRMGKDKKTKIPYRRFVTDKDFQGKNKEHGITNLFRYPDLFTDSSSALGYFEDIPFLNGGLFECLDREDPDNKNRMIRLDGFTTKGIRPTVPNKLFFSGEIKGIDLSEIYHDTKRKKESVSGLIRILNRYKFTIVENTPIDQEIALDPELLGKVFENLLASYNEETKTTARKQTGSFYTPRPIVDYMVDESLKAYLECKVTGTILSRSPDSNPDKIVGATLQPYNPETPTAKTRHNLPHWTQDGTTYWITFRLADSLPQEKLTTWKTERDTWTHHHPEPWSDADWKEYNEQFGERLQEWLDAGAGECHLRRPEIRAIVEKCLTHFDGDRYDLGPWVIMPNHVHLLIRSREGQSLSKILQGIKGVSARECNALLSSTGKPFWQEESFDHIVRSRAQFDRLVRYIEENPMKAKLRESEYSVAETILSRTSATIPDNLGGVSSVKPETILSRTSATIPDNLGGVSSVKPETGLSRTSATTSANLGGDSSVKPETGLSRLRSRLDQLFTYTEEPHQFSEAEVASLITAIDEVKILDPACGSGAFPMGVLHKLVTILGKLDPDNQRWKQTQLQKLDSAPMREELERAFADNNDDYGRKLYLIENCLYGVDIQPIAIQITKLRFFISLVCDQQIQSGSDNPVGDSSKQTETRLSRLRSRNHGIRPLPNLETKFVAANSLIGLPEMERDSLIDPRVGDIEKEIESLYHSHFSIQRRDQKLSVQRRIRGLRNEMATILAESLMSPAKGKHIAEWDPFDPQTRADFFDPHWMFGISVASGFDVTIGNPPYVRADEQSDWNRYQREQILASGQYETLWEKWDLFVPFLERSFKLLRPGGVSTMIVSDAFCHSKYAQKAQNWFLKHARILRLDFCGEVKIFDAAVHNVITFFQKADGTKWKPERRLHREAFGEVTKLPTDEQAKLTYRAFFPDQTRHDGFSVSILAIEAICYVSFGCRPNSNEKRAKGLFVGADLVSHLKDKDHPKPYIEAKDIVRWTYSQSRWLEWGTERSPGLLTRPTFVKLYEVPEKIVAADVSGAENRAAYDDGKVFHSHTLITFVPWHSLHGVRNNSLKKAARYQGEKPPRPDLPRREDLESVSRRFSVKYLLGVMNSGSARDFLRANRRSNIHLYPDDWKKLPIPDVSTAQQKPIVALVEQILTLKRANPAADISALETQLDAAVATLYGLTPEDTK